ncbi:carbohydrate ABC transporter permease [Actinopolymorpha sp. B17G11]|uniref:carbohydrate ABC transporter permease n=1 Tax=Actinopolymorpha sp. B17G11 TaxID=3160861 RepID=UPI0032E45271
MTTQLAGDRRDKFPRRGGDERSLARTRRRQRILRRVPWWIGAVFLVGTAALWVFPFVWMASASLKDNMEMFSGGLNLFPSDFVWGNYVRAWNDAHFGRYLINTVIVTLATVVIVTVRCATCGYVLARYRFRGSKIFLGVLIATLFVPTGYTIIPVVKISMQLGLLDSLTGMIVALSGAAYVSAILLYWGYFRRIPRELEEAAVVDGAGFVRTFFSVMLPLAMPVTATVAVLTFITTWNSFFLPLVFSFSRPNIRTVSVGMQAFVGETATDWTGMAAAGVISIVPVVAVFIFLQRYFVEGISGAVKS